MHLFPVSAAAAFMSRYQHWLKLLLFKVPLHSRDGSWVVMVFFSVIVIVMVTVVLRMVKSNLPILYKLGGNGWYTSFRKTRSQIGKETADMR